MIKQSPSVFQRLAVACLILLLAGCGWQLRGSVGAGLTDVPIQVTGPVDSRFLAQVGDELGNLGARLVADAAQADLVVEVVEADRSRDTVATDQRGFATEREVTFSVRFRVRPGGQAEPEATAGPIQRVRLQESYPVDPDNLQAGQAEEEAIVEDLREDAIRLMLSRVARSR